jgi:Lysophospholipase L1 and related esterases
MHLFRRPLFLLALLVCAASSLRAAPAARTILFLGDSLTAGYGLPDPATQSYPALIQEKLDARAAAAGPGASRWRVANAGVSGDTTSGGLRRIDWVLRQPVSILVLALGSNDGLRGLDPELVRRNLEAIVERVRAKHPDVRVLLVGQRMPPSMGDYAPRFDAIFPALAEKHGWAFAPFLLEGVGGVRELNQADAIHPNEEGHRRMAETVWAALAPLLDPAPAQGRR